jgi:dipeptidyl aminopeptidase/acylaminoacyl peptidase
MNREPRRIVMGIMSHTHLPGKRLLFFEIFFLFALGLSYAQDGVSLFHRGADSVGYSQLSPEQTLKRRRISDLQLSPDGTRIAMTVAEPVKGTKRNSDVWIYEIKTRQLSRFTTSDESDNRPRWSPDGKTLAFLSDRSEKTQIYFIPVRGGEAEALTEGKNSVRSFEWSPDGRWIAFLAPEPKTEEEEKKEEEKDDARVVDRDDRVSRLWIIDVDSRDVRQLTRDNWRISTYCWMPQADRLIISATEHPQPELLTHRIYSLRISDGAIQHIASPARPYGNLRISPDGKTIAYVGTHVDGPTAHDLFLHPVSGGEPRNLTRSSIDRPVSSFIWRKSGTLLVLATTGFTNRFYNMTQDGKAETIEGFEVHPMDSFTAGSGLLAFVAQTATEAPELWISQRSGRAEKVTHFNAEWDTIAVIRPEIFHYPSLDGRKIEAALLKPKDYKRGTRVPLVVLVHGGPSGRWSDSFQAWGQLLVGRGFAVLYPNIRGSTGYGYEFLAMNRRDWGGGDFKDVMAGVDFMIERGIADPERLGIGGWSYGGYMAAWAVTQTDRFKASVSGAPMTDLASEYGTEMASINSYDTWYLGNPYENLDLFVERSPVTHVKKARTPTLILCGENDVTDPIGQCQQFYRGLKRYGIETEFVVYPREGHGIREEKHQIDLLNRVIDWFIRYLK